MSKIFGVVRGSFHIQRDAYIGASMVYIPGMDTATIKNTLVSNFSFSDSEKNSIIQCFNDVNHIYAFGHDPEQSGFSITYITFLGEKCMKDDKFKPGNSLSELVGAYNDIKVSKYANTIDVMFGNGVMIKGIILSLSVSTYETEFNTVTVTVSGKAMSLER